MSMLAFILGLVVGSVVIGVFCGLIKAPWWVAMAVGCLYGYVYLLVALPLV